MHLLFEAQRRNESNRTKAEEISLVPYGGFQRRFKQFNIHLGENMSGDKL